MQESSRLYLFQLSHIAYTLASNLTYIFILGKMGEIKIILVDFQTKYCQGKH